MTALEQRLTGENKVLRDLIKQAGNVIDDVLDDNDLPGYEVDAIVELLSQIKCALSGAPADLLEVAP